MVKKIIGHEDIYGYFDSAIRIGSLGHAYLFYGPEGIGKKTFALMVAKAVGLRESLAKNLPDHEFESNPDLFVLNNSDPVITLENIKNIRRFINQSSVFLHKKSVIINGAEKMNKESSNALLKALEEPRGDVVFFLIITHKRLLIETIISRCQQIYFAPLKKADIVHYLLKEYNVDNKRAGLIAEVVNGSLAQALSLADNRDIQKIYQDVLEVPALLSKPYMDRFNYVSETIKDNLYLKNWLDLVLASFQTLDVSDRLFIKKFLKMYPFFTKTQYNQKTLLESVLL